VNSRCRSETCCTWLAGNAGPKKVVKNCLLGTITQLCRATGISSQLRHIMTIGEKLSNMSSRCSHNMLNFGPLTADICWRVWGAPCKFQQVSHLGILLHGTLVVCVSHTLRPSRWASAHILVCICMIGRAVSFSRQKKLENLRSNYGKKTTKFAENLC